MRKITNILFALLIVVSAGCVGMTHVSDIQADQHEYDMGPVPYAYHVRKPKILFAGIDGAYIDFDVLARVELRNNTNRHLTADVKCVFGKHSKQLHSRTKMEIEMKPKSSKLVKMWAYFRDTSVNGYGALCRAIFFRR